MEKMLLISELENEMFNQLYDDMKAQIQLGKPFHSVKGCIHFDEPRKWLGVPIGQVDFCLLKEVDKALQLILWTSRKPDEDDFISVCWPPKFTWNLVYKYVTFDIKYENN